MAVDNVLLGYGTLLGTNLVDQAASGALARIADADLRPGRGTRYGLEGAAVTLRGDAVQVEASEVGDVLRPAAGLDAGWAADAGLPGPLAGLVADLGALAREEHTFEFYGVDGFFDRVAGATHRPLATDAIRRWPATEPALVGEFVEADPAEPRSVLSGLVDGCRTHTHYDASRYVAGSIQDNVIFGAADLRAPFQDPVDFGSLLASDDKVGLFCYEFTHRSLEALHAVPAMEQTVPVAGARVWDQRHKHVYTAVASVVRDDGDLVVPMTFVDYTHTTLYHDARLRGLLGEGFEAFNPRHRATVVHWDPYA